MITLTEEEAKEVLNALLLCKSAYTNAFTNADDFAYQDLIDMLYSKINGVK